MKKLLGIGEALIDFISEDVDSLVKDSKSFTPKVGGAPANVCGAYAKLGGRSGLITMVGKDAFGDKIIDYLKENNISTEYLYQTDDASTSLAFVSRKKDGERDFSFYRKPGADMLLEASQVKDIWFKNTYAMHFCSVGLGKFPMKQAHLKAIEYAMANKVLISFDPNLRPQLWASPSELKYTVLQFIPMCNILKISIDELEFLTGKTEIEDALDELFIGSVELIVYTMGSKGAKAFTKNARAHVDGVKGLNVIDTTGAGDAFIGSMLFQMFEDQIKLPLIKKLTNEDLERYLTFSNNYCSKCVEHEGAIASYPTREEMGLPELND